MAIVDSVHQYITIPRLAPSTAPRKFFPDSRDVTLIWGESCCGQKKNGPQTAPPVVCSEEFLKLLKELGWKVSINRCKQVFEASPSDAPCFEPFCVSKTCYAVADAVEEAHKSNSFPMLIGGDHCLAMGSVLGTSRKHKDFCVIWFDAHADINTVETSPSGNMHGMPVAALLGLDGMKKAPGFKDGQFTCLNKDRIGYIGLRDVDEGEKETLKALGITTAFFMPDLDKHGIAQEVQIILDKINPNRDLPIHISFDVDGMDPIDAPSTGTAVPNGVRLHEAIEFVRTVRDTGLLASMDVVEVNPALGDERDVDVTVRNARWIAALGLGAAA